MMILGSFDECMHVGITESSYTSNYKVRQRLLNMIFTPTYMYLGVSITCHE